MPSKIVLVQLRVPEKAYRRIARQAAALNMSLNQYLVKSTRKSTGKEEKP